MSRRFGGTTARRTQLGVAGLLMLLVAGCGRSDADEARPPYDATAVGGALTVVADDARFVERKLLARPGAHSITFDNRDDGQAHNLAVYRGDRADGDEGGATDVEKGPVRQMLKLDVAAGAYAYHCQVHTSMKGTLTVE